MRTYDKLIETISDRQGARSLRSRFGRAIGMVIVVPGTFIGTRTVPPQGDR